MAVAAEDVPSGIAVIGRAQLEAIVDFHLVLQEPDFATQIDGEAAKSTKLSVESYLKLNPETIENAQNRNRSKANEVRGEAPPIGHD
jgi:hypothetical protein